MSKKLIGFMFVWYILTLVLMGVGVMIANEIVVVYLHKVYDPAIGVVVYLIVAVIITIIYFEGFFLPEQKYTYIARRRTVEEIKKVNKHGT